MKDIVTMRDMLTSLGRGILIVLVVAFALIILDEI